MPKSPLLHRHLFAALAASLFWIPVAHASGDDGCYAPTTLRPNTYSCANVPMLARQRHAHQRDADDGRQRQGRTGVSRPEDDPGEGPDQPDHRAVPDGLLRMDLYRAEEPDKTGSATDAEAPSNQYADGEGSICRSMASGADAFNDALGGAGGLPPTKPHGCARRAPTSRRRLAPPAAQVPRGPNRRSSRRSASSSPRTSTARMRSTAPTSSPRPGPSRARHTREPVAEGNRPHGRARAAERRAGQRVRPRQPHADARPRDEGVARRREHGVSHLPEGVPEGALCDLRKRAVAACRVAWRQRHAAGRPVRPRARALVADDVERAADPARERTRQQAAVRV